MSGMSFLMLLLFVWRICTFLFSLNMNILNNLTILSFLFPCNFIYRSIKKKKML